MAVETVSIIGAGLMGGGIAQVCATHGLHVGITDTMPGAGERALSTIRGRLERDVQRGRMSDEAMTEALGRIAILECPEEGAGAGLVIEAIVEDAGAKRALFHRLGTIAPESTILASNTSSLPISELAAASGRPDRMLGLHFFNPPYQLRLLEVVPNENTSAETLAAALAFCETIERTVVQVKDAPGFIVNRLLIPYVFDAIRVLESGVGSAEDIDRACTTGLGHPMGPLATADLVGLDTLLLIGESMFHEFGEPRFKAPTSLRRLVALGDFGRKTGKGYFSYPPASGR